MQTLHFTLSFFVNFHKINKMFLSNISIRFKLVWLWMKRKSKQGIRNSVFVPHQYKHHETHAGYPPAGGYGLHSAGAAPLQRWT